MQVEVVVMEKLTEEQPVLVVQVELELWLEVLLLELVQ